MENNHKNRNFLLVFNRRAGKGSSIHKKELILKYLEKNNCKYRIITTSELALEENLEVYDSVVAVGGDGTIMKVIPFLANTKIKLGIIPCGTANLFASRLNIPMNIQKAVDILVSGTSTSVDIGKAGDEYFALRVGAGYDAEVVKGTKRLWKRRLGYLAYVVQGMINSFKVSNRHYKVTIDNKPYNINANSIIVANSGNMFRNFFSIAPFSSLHDGKLDVFIMKTKNFWDFLTVFLRVLTGRVHFSSKVMFSQAKSIKIESLCRDIHIDGEPCHNSIIDISLIPKALMVVIP